MEKLKYILIVEAEQDFTILIRILTRIARNRVTVQELHTIHQENPHLQRFTIMISETTENVIRLSERINKEIDVHWVKISKQIN